jgi:hypothetical protein
MGTLSIFVQTSKFFSFYLELYKNIFKNLRIGRKSVRTSEICMPTGPGPVGLGEFFV